MAEAMSIERLQELHDRGCITFNQLLAGIDKSEAAGRVPPRSSTASQSHASHSGSEPTRPMEEESVRRERPFAESEGFGDLGEEDLGAEERDEMVLDPEGGVDDDGSLRDDNNTHTADSVAGSGSLNLDDGEERAIRAARAPSATTAAPCATREPLGAPQLVARQRTLDGGFILPLASVGQMPALSRKAMTARKARVNKQPASAVEKNNKGLGPARHNEGRGKSKMMNGIRKNDIKKKELLPSRLARWPDEGLKIVGGQLWCTYCKRQIGSGADNVTKHVKANVHIDNKNQSKASNVSLNALQAALEEYRQTAIDSGVQYQGMACVPEDTQLARAECLEQIIKAGIEPQKIDKLRPWLESRMQISLVGKSHLMETYFPPLQLKERRLLTDSFKDAFIGCYHDGTTHEGELLSIVYRAVQPGFKFAIKLVRMPHLEKSLNADHIKALLHSTISSMQTHPHRVLAFMSDCCAPNLAAYNDGLKEMYPYSDCNGCLPHTGHNVEQNLETPNVNEFMLLYNACVGHSATRRSRECFSEKSRARRPCGVQRRAGSPSTTSRRSPCCPMR